MRKSVLAAAASFAIATGALVTGATAADFIPPPVVPMPAPVVHTWSGLYLGGHIGYGEAEKDARIAVWRPGDFDGGFAPIHTRGHGLDASGILGGVQGGFNWQVGSFVFGIEGDISFTDWSDNARSGHDFFDGAILHEVRHRVSADADFLASVRGRAGIAFDQLLLYGTGGVAFVDAEVRWRTGLDGEGIFRHKEDFSETGWVFGGGAEWAAVPNRFSIGVEGLIYKFDEDNVRTRRFSGHPIVDDGTVIRIRSSFDDAWVIRGRANFHF